MPLPVDLHDLPPLEDLLVPDPDIQATVITEAEAVVHNAFVAVLAAVAPSPARAEPHDAATWLPLPDVHSLPEVTREPLPAPPLHHRVKHHLPPIRVFLLALVASALVVTVAWGGRQLTAPGGSKVTLAVDGTRVAVRSEASNVGQFLAQRHVRLAGADTVSPPRSAAMHDGLRIQVARAFPVTVDFDGVRSTVLTTEHEPDALAKQVGGGKLVAVRNTPGSLHEGSSVVLRTRHNGALVIDGKEINYDSASLTVGELLETYSVVLVGDDRVEPGRDTLLVNGMTPRVVRVGGDLQQEAEAIPFTEQRQADPTLAIGQTRVAQNGVDGVMTLTYKVTTENGAAAGRTLLSKVPAVAAIPRIIAYGTMADWHWDALAACESGGKWNTVDTAAEPYDGGIGIYRPTWKAFGGLEFAPNAGLATREEQIIVGQRIYNTYGGWSQSWGCARQMHWQ
jgi:uncharacterized protein YabE (DUF348 family)